MDKSEITKNLKQIKKLLEEESPIIAKERIGFLINDIEKERLYRSQQGRSNVQLKSNEKAMFVSCMGLLVILLGIILYGLLTNG